METSFIKQRGPEISLEDVEQFEAELNTRLDEDYRQFLLNVNGGISAVGFEENGEVEDILFHSLTPEYSGLRRSYDELKAIEDSYLPFASDASDRLFLLSLPGNQHHVCVGTYVFDEDPDPNEEYLPKAITIRKIANSFRDFVSLLQPLVVEECPIENLGRYGNGESLAKYLEDGGDINTHGKNQMSIVCEAAKNDNLSLVKECIKKNASLSRAIEIAVINKHPRIVRCLVENGADINECSTSGKRPLDWAIGIGSEEIRSVLIGLGAIGKPY